jgi:predicted RNase H-like nuclease (RuvC/YqgF family)
LKPSSTDQEAQGEPFSGSLSIEALTKERDGLAALLVAREAHIQALTQELDRLRADLEAERAAHREDRAKDRETLDRAMDRQHELSVLLLQEQNRHKPFRLLLAEKAGSIFHRKEKNENDT